MDREGNVASMQIHGSILFPSPRHRQNQRSFERRFAGTVQHVQPTHSSHSKACPSVTILICAMAGFMQLVRLAGLARVFPIVSGTSVSGRAKTCRFVIWPSVIRE